jgi:hypothetical protein
MSSIQYLVNGAGDVWAERRDSGEVHPVDPDGWGWTAISNRAKAELRRTVEEISALPEYEVEIQPAPRFVPGPPNSQRANWEGWPSGHAPPAAVQSKGGESGTLAYFDRFTDALAHLVEAVEKDPSRGPFLVHDWVSGRVLRVTYTPPPPVAGDEGLVYVVTDGHAAKIGWTSGTVGRRISALQTGNPRPIIPLATVIGASDAVERVFHEFFAEHHLSGEWFSLDEVNAAVRKAGGWVEFVHQVLGSTDWTVQVHERVKA